MAEPETNGQELTDVEEQDDQQTQAEGVEERCAPTTGGPQVYRLEQESASLSGKVLAKGDTVTLSPEEAQRLASSGVQLSWAEADQEPEEETEPEEPEEETDPPPAP